jgi:hypothetical protein
MDAQASIRSCQLYYSLICKGPHFFLFFFFSLGHIPGTNSIDANCINVAINDQFA